jgi:CDP-glucose 4,6-dehydratase
VSLQEFWKGRRVFLTGHTGFKGGWLALWLQHLGAEVCGYALEPPTRPSIFEVARVGNGMRTVLADVRDLEKLTSALLEFRQDVLFHLAAQSLVRPSYSDPVSTYAINVMGTVHVLEAIRTVGKIRAAVIVTSDKCYENNEWEWSYRESDPMGGYDPYSNSKGCAELVTSAYRRSFFNSSNSEQHGVALASARAGNVIGGGDWATDRLVPDFFRAVTKGEAIKIRSPHSIRPWQHVLEPLSGYLQLAERLMGAGGVRYASAWNFGPSDEDAISVDDLARKLTATWGERASYTVETDVQLHEATFLKLECSKARSLIGWRPYLDVNSAVAWTVAWHKAMRDGHDMREFTIAQIVKFETGS